MGRISAGVFAVLAAIPWISPRAQEPAFSDAAVERASGKPEPIPGPPGKPASESAAAIAALDQRIAPLKEAFERSKNSKDKAATARLGELIDVLTRRRRLLLDWEEVVRKRTAAEHPEQTPEAEAAEAKAAAERDRAALARAAKDPASLLPEVFRSAVASEAAIAEMNVAVERAQAAFDDANKAVEAISAAPGQKAADPLVEARADRDEIRKKMATIAPRQAEAQTAASVASSPEARDLAREKLGNLEWERKIEAERLREAEARIEGASRRAAFNDLRLEAKKVRLDLARTTLEALQARYKEHVSQHVARLKQLSANEGARAAISTDPLDRYKALRSKELLDQKALLEERDNEAKTTPAVSLQDQANKARIAEDHFEGLKKVVRDGRSSDVVARRLNNNYRRLASERASLVRNELAKVAEQSDGFDRELTEIESVELDDLQGDRAFREDLLSRLPAKRQAEALALFEAFEKQKYEILQGRKRVLNELSARAEKTRAEILKRVAIMDAEHAFIRTHLFWVRDQPPLGLASLDQGRRDARDAARTLLGMAGEAWSPSRREPILPEFLLCVAGLVASPWVLYRIRKILRQRLRASGCVAAKPAS